MKAKKYSFKEKVQQKAKKITKLLLGIISGETTRHGATKMINLVK